MLRCIRDLLNHRLSKFLALLLALSFQAQGRDLIVSIGQIPMLSDSPEKGLFIDFVKGMDEVYTEGRLIIGVFPFPRSIKNVVEGKADLHIPLVNDPTVNMDTVPYRFATTPMGTVAIVLYTNIKKPLTKEMILKATSLNPYPYIIELNRGSEIYYNMPTVPTYDIISCFGKLEIGRTDAYLGAQEEADNVCRTQRLKNIKRELWEEKDDLVVIQKGAKGDEVDKILTECLARMKKNGSYQKLYSKIHLPYDNWQPYQMKW